jgi:hypothetical protein
MRYASPFFILSAVSLLLAACHPTEKMDASAVPAGKGRAQTTCYAMHEGKDLTAIQVTQDGSTVTGYLSWEPDQKDGGHGSFSGSQTDGVIKVDYTYMIEGATQTEQKYFKPANDKLLVGTGELTEDSKGKLIVKNPATLKYDTALTKTDCAKVKDAIDHSVETAAIISKQK